MSGVKIVRLHTVVCCLLSPLLPAVATAACCLLAQCRLLPAVVAAASICLLLHAVRAIFCLRTAAAAPLEPLESWHRLTSTAFRLALAYTTQ